MVTRNEDKVSIIKSDSLQQAKRSLKLDLGRSDDIEDDSSDQDESGAHLLGAKNLYIDSPRVGLVDEEISDGEISRRKRVGMATILGLFMSVMLCVLMMKYLSEHESFSALPPTQQRFMSATTAKGAKENLEQYTSGNRHTGSTGDYEMAKYIRSKAIDFGIEDNQIKVDEFEILVNEPETLRIEVKEKSGSATVHDLMANYKTKRNSRMPLPPFHLYSMNGTATGKLVFANYGTSQDYAALKRAGISVEGNIVLVRMGDITLPAKVVIAGNHGAAGILTFNDPVDDGVNKGKQFPDGPWRVNDQASFGSVYMGNGDPSTPDGFSATAIDRITVDEVFSVNNTYNILPRIVSMPVSAKLAQSLMQSITSGKNASEIFGSAWMGGGLNVTYRTGLSDVAITIENRNKYSLKKVWNVMITIKGSREGDRYVIVGSQRDSLNSGAVSPGSGNAVFIEMLRAVGDLLTNGWVPHRTLLFASFGGEQFGSVGSSEWIDRHFSHLGGRGIIYMNLRDVVRGAGPLDCEAAASLRKNIYLMSAEVHQPKAEVNIAKLFAATPVSTQASKSRRLQDEQTSAIEAHVATATDSAKTSMMIATGIDDDDDEPDIPLLPLNTTFNREDLPDDGDSIFTTWLKETRKTSPSAKLPKVNLPGSGNRISPFLARLGIPSLELSFEGNYYGVEGSANDTIEWMKRFADPTFSFHRAAAQLYGSIMLSFSDAIFLQYDFTEVARDLRYGEAYLMDAITKAGLASLLPMTRLSSSIATFETAAVAVTQEMREMSDHMVSVINGELIVDLKRVREMNTRLLMAEKAFLLPAGLPHMPWLKHSLYGISEWDDYRVGYYPGVTQELKRGNPITIKRELIRLCQTIEQAADTLSTTVL